MHWSRYRRWGVDGSAHCSTGRLARDSMQSIAWTILSKQHFILSPELRECFTRGDAASVPTAQQPAICTARGSAGRWPRQRPASQEAEPCRFDDAAAHTRLPMGLHSRGPTLLWTALYPCSTRHTGRSCCRIKHSFCRSIRRLLGNRRRCHSLHWIRLARGRYTTHIHVV